MVEQVEDILKYELREIIASPLVLKLLSVYSILFLNGAQPGSCESCIKKYYSELKLKGMARAINYEEVRNRTCKPKWNGLKYVSKAAAHFNSDLVTDKEAMDLIKRGILRKDDFEVLPERMVQMQKKAAENFAKNETAEVKESKPKKKTTKK